MNDMTPDQTIDQRIAAWLTAEAPSQLPDRVLAATFATTRTARQVGWHSGWRSLRMRSMPALVAAGAVAILVLVIGGVAIIGSPSKVASPSPSASAAPTATPSASAVPSPSVGSLYPTALGAAIVGLDGAVVSDPGLPPSAWAPALSPDGTRIAYVDGRRLLVRDLPVGSVPRDLGVTLTGVLSGVSSDFGDDPVDAAPAWSPDGTTIAYVSGGDLYRVAADGTESATRLTRGSGVEEWPAWSPDGAWIYYVDAGEAPLDDSAISLTQEVWRIGANGGASYRVSTDAVAELQPDVARNGTMAVWQDGALVAMDPVSGRSTKIDSPNEVSGGWNPRWSPDGTKLAMLILDGSNRTNPDPALGVPSGLPLLEVHVVDLKTGDESVVGPRVAAFWNPVSWTPNGRGLLINRYDCVVPASGAPCP